MFRMVVMMLCLFVSACAAPAQLDRSANNQIAMVASREEVRVRSGQYIRLRQGQVLAPASSGGVEEFCSLTRAFFNAGGSSFRMCFRDTNGDGRFDRAYGLLENRRYGAEVDIAYTTQPFPCENCRPPDDDIYRITDNAVLAGYSIAPRDLQHYVRLALGRDKTFESRMQNAALSAGPEPRRVVDIATREILDRVAMARCTGLFSPGAAALVPFGAWIAMAAAGEERTCIDEYIRTGQMPPMDRPQLGEPGSPTT